MVELKTKSSEKWVGESEAVMQVLKSVEKLSESEHQFYY